MTATYAGDLANIGYAQYYVKSGKVTWSDTTCRIFGLEPGDPRIGFGFGLDHIHEADRENYARIREAVVRDGVTREARYRVVRHPDEELRYVHTHIHCQKTTDDGTPECIFLLIKDVTQMEKTRLTAEHSSLHDPLTGLPNRKKFNERLLEAIGNSGRHNSATSLLLLDLDHFKEVNDTLGHPVGDALLIQVGERLRHATPESETVARLGGDEFAIVVSHRPQSANIDEICRAVTESFLEPFSVNGRVLNVTASIGVASCPQDGIDADTLMRNADIALYRAKGDGRATYRCFENEMNERLQERHNLEAQLRNALAANS